MPSRRRLRVFALLACIATASAPRASHADPPSAANVASARQHFDKARALYSQGAYREAIVELEAAHDFDPSAKDLVFNLGVIYEKLADIDGALRWFRLYTTMSLTPQESARVDSYIHRLEGAKPEIEQRPLAGPAPPPSPLVRGEPPAPPAAPAHRALSPVQTSSGRVDGWTIGAASLSGLSLAFGIVLAVRAVQDQPPSNSLTQPTGPTYLDLVNRVQTAHTEAMLADAAFGAALVSAAAAAYFYFARPRLASVSSASTGVSVAPLERGGGMLFLKGPF